MPVSTITVHQAIEDYLLVRGARYSAATVRNEGHVLRRFAETVTPRPIQLRNLTAEHVERWFLDLRREHRDRSNQVRPPIEAATWNYYRSRVKAFTEWATRKGLLRHDLLAHVTPMRTVRKVRQQPSVDLLLEMLERAAEPRDRALLAIACNTGLRASEIARIRVGDLDLDGLTLRVWVSKSQIQDDMPMTSDLVDEMARWLPLYARAIERPLTPEDYLLPACGGPRYFWRTVDGVRVRDLRPGTYMPHRPVTKLHRVAQQGLRSVGLESRHEGVHTLRRAVARAFYDSLKVEGHEVAIRAVMALLHHSNQSTTEAYLGLSHERQTRDLTLRGKSFLQPATLASVTAIR